MSIPDADVIKETKVVRACGHHPNYSIKNNVGNGVSLQLSEMLITVNAFGGPRTTQKPKSPRSERSSSVMS